MFYVILGFCRKNRRSNFSKCFEAVYRVGKEKYFQNQENSLHQNTLHQGIVLEVSVQSLN